MRCAYALACVTVKIFVEKNVIIETMLRLQNRIVPKDSSFAGIIF